MTLISDISFLEEILAKSSMTCKFQDR